MQASLCKESYHSIKGMVESQIKSDKKPRIAGKGYKTALRIINLE